MTSTSVLGSYRLEWLPGAIIELGLPGVGREPAVTGHSRHMVTAQWLPPFPPIPIYNGVRERKKKLATQQRAGDLTKCIVFKYTCHDGLIRVDNLNAVSGIT